MDRFDRIYELHTVLASARLPVSKHKLLEELECAPATLKRTIRAMRLYLGAPITYDREHNGYYYDRKGEHPYELPGLWFNAEELYALLVSEHLLSHIQPGLLQAHIGPLRHRIRDLLTNEHLASGELGRRVRILQIGARKPVPRHFGTVAGALLQRRRLNLVYHGRERDAITERVVSPLRLVHYRDNWYLDAWCHLKKGLRSFALDRVRDTHPRKGAAKEIPDGVLDRYFATAYGIFAGRPRATAVLRFTPERARWVADEAWHPEQEGRFLENGSYELRLPYGDPRELTMDILKYGPDVEVLGPDSLRRRVAALLRSASTKYGPEWVSP